jgi:hypothetical protein
VPDAAVNAVTLGVPIPRDGSLFGWLHKTAVTALVAVHAEYTPVTPEPSWAVMPLAGTPESKWPPFTGEVFIGRWLWDYYQSGQLVSLDNLIAGTPGAIFWVDTEATLGWDSCVVARELTTSEGHTFPRGSYVYHQVLRTGKQVPDLEAMLHQAASIDLAPRFRRCL